jgi:hypothetical protein
MCRLLPGGGPEGPPAIDNQGGRAPYQPVASPGERIKHSFGYRSKVGRRVQNPSPGHGRWALGLTAAAFVWALALVAGAFFVPVYSVAEGGSDTGVVSTTSTLVGENGLGVLLPVALPAAVVGLVWLALHRKCSRGSARSGRVAGGLIILLGTFCVLTGFSIGLFVLPTVLLLAGAATVTPGRST